MPLHTARIQFPFLLVFLIFNRDQFRHAIHQRTALTVDEYASLFLYFCRERMQCDSSASFETFAFSGTTSRKKSFRLGKY
jgi:hypothetical protein